MRADSVVVRARIDLERGRIRRSGGDAEAALPLFESAFHTAVEGGELVLAADAAHMAALAAPTQDAMLAWTQTGIDVAESSADPSVHYWLGPLLNNLGWEHFEAGEYGDALRAFERALTERERDPANPSAIEIARYAVAKTLRALGRPGEAAPLLEQATAWAESEGGRTAGFTRSSQRAMPISAEQPKQRTMREGLSRSYPEADPTFTHDDDRAACLRRLAS